MRRIAVLAISMIVALSFPSSIGAQGPPEDVSGVFTLEGLCDFPIEFDLSGKGKTIALPGGGFIMTSPGLHATLTNLSAPEHQVTLNITGSITETVLESGNVQRVHRGRNLFFDPSTGLLLLIGQWDGGHG
jgi:hypothetical protein